MFTIGFCFSVNDSLSSGHLSAVKKNLRFRNLNSKNYFKPSNIDYTSSESSKNSIVSYSSEIDLNLFLNEDHLQLSTLYATENLPTILCNEITNQCKYKKKGYDFFL